MFGHTVDTVNSRIITCLDDTCDIFQEGTWNYLVNTTEYRKAHSSVVHGDSVLLLGGRYTNTTEVISSTGEAAMPGLHNIRHGSSHCTIDLDKTLVVLGGNDTYDLVTEYSKLYMNPGCQRWAPRPLPSLQEGRRQHACTWYAQAHNKVGYFSPQFFPLLFALPHLPQLSFHSHCTLR